MPKAVNLPLTDIAMLDNLAHAAWRAAKGKRAQREVRAFFLDCDRSLRTLSADLRRGLAPTNEYRTFTVFDPKRRRIHAPVFVDRIVHHALMSHVGPELERALVSDSYACRLGKGSLAAVKRAQYFARRYPWYGKLDVRAYFHSIHHQTLAAILRRCIKGGGLGLCRRIIDGFHTRPGRGLPIGALTSQYYANIYLGQLDRLLSAAPEVQGMVRYMDDVVFWCRDKRSALRMVHAADTLIREGLLLRLHPGWVQRSKQGLSFLGFRVFPGRLWLSRRRKRRYRAARARAEQRYLAGLSGVRQLQVEVTAALAVTAHADSCGWRRTELSRRPPVEA